MGTAVQWIGANVFVVPRGVDLRITEQRMSEFAQLVREVRLVNVTTKKLRKLILDLFGSTRAIAG